MWRHHVRHSSSTLQAVLMRPALSPAQAVQLGTGIHQHGGQWHCQRPVQVRLAARIAEPLKSFASSHCWPPLGNGICGRSRR
eukprot:scaffold3299_cov116-Isochrysis_galbana.AAC.6